MPKNLIIVYSAGSCGDFISMPWIATNQFYSAIDKHEINLSGRAVPIWNQKFLNQFPKQKYLHHYSRNWTNDLEKLSELDQPFLILTTVAEQAQLIKNHFGDQVYILAINYKPNQWPFVAKSFCNKVLNYPNYLTKDDIGENFLNAVAKNEQQRQQFLYLGEKGKLGHWYAKKLTEGYIEFPYKEFIYQGDYTLMLDDILSPNVIINKLSEISKELNVMLNLESFSTVYGNWFNRQFLPSDIDHLFKNKKPT